MPQEKEPSSTIGQLAGEVIGGRYRLGERLGQGGMGVVYTATQESLARPVALKVLQPMLAQNGESILRFRAEAERAGRLAHPHIVQILDFGHEPGRSAWIAMELLKGESLAARIERGPLSEAEVVRIAKETLSALEAAHAAHLVHRDLKPDNIFLADVPGIGTSVKVLDFGIAKLLDDESAGKLTATGMLIGTPLYMAPEQARGGDVDQRADLYALGAVLYEALTGRPPFTGKNYNALLYSVLSETPVPIASARPDISPELAGVVARAMEKSPATRWQSAHAMAEALRAVHPSEHLPIMRPPGDATMATAPTMATPIPAEPLGATTPALGGTGVGGASAARATPPTRPTPAPAPLPSTSAPVAVPSTLVSTPAPVALPSAPAPSAASHASKKQPALRWWPVALAGGALAAATLAFVSTSTMMSPGSDATVALAPGYLEEQEVLPPAGPAVGASTPTPMSMPTPMPMPTPTPTPPVPQAPSPDPTVPPDGDGETVTVGPGPRTRPAHATKASPPGRSPRPVVRWAGGSFAGMTSSWDVRRPVMAAGEWAECWPRGVPAPDVNRGREFLVDVAPDGRVLSVRPGPGNGEPVAFSSCVVARMQSLTFAPTATGEVVHIRVGFGIESP